MQLESHNIVTGESQRRNITGIIKDESVLYVFNAPSVTIEMETREKHNLVPGSHVILESYGATSSPIARKSCTVDIITDTRFRINEDFSVAIRPLQITKFDEGRTLIMLGKKIDCLNGREDGFSLYSLKSDDLEYIEGCQIPKNSYGEYLYNQIIVPMDFTPTTSKDIRTMCPFVFDYRFFLDYQEGETLYAGYQIYEESTYISIPVGMNMSHDFNLNKDTAFSDRISAIVNSSYIPEPVDMERVVYTPCTSDGIRISEINFYPHFRNRCIDDYGTLSPTWSTDNNLPVDKIWNQVVKTGTEDVNMDIADDLYYLGFTNDDVKYQKKKLKRSFLRLLFYDSDDRISQSLLAYSTIFYDTGEAYTQMVKSIVLDPRYTLKSGGRHNGEALPKIDCRFRTMDRYNFNRSSEGFYLYLYPYDLAEKATNTTGESATRTIYMKAEFNHAGYGKTVPFLMPLSGEETEYRTTYLVTETVRRKVVPTPETGETEVEVEETHADMESYFKDLLLPIEIRFNGVENRYEYSFPTLTPVDSKDGKRKIINIPMVEPLVNGVPKEEDNE